MKDKQDILIATIRKRHNLPDSADVRVKSVAAEMKAESEGGYNFTATITKDILDRDREVVIPDGADTSEFDTSGNVFWNHDYDKPIALPTGLKKGKGLIESSATFLKRPADYVGEWLADYARALVKQANDLGRAIGVSVGFIPMDMRDPNDRDRKQYGDSVANIITRWKLLEWSIAPVQSNPGAVVTAVGKGLLTKSAAQAMFGVDVKEAPKKKKVYVYVSQGAAPKMAKRGPSVGMLVKRALIKAKGGLYHE